jgi:hypothetical protein
MGVDQHVNAGVGRASPAKFGGADNDLLAIRLQSSNTLFSAARTSNSRSRCLVL